jgi:glycosyltransferase involved in cell wall biosynthesis
VRIVSPYSGEFYDRFRRLGEVRIVNAPTAIRGPLTAGHRLKQNTAKGLLDRWARSFDPHIIYANSVHSLVVANMMTLPDAPVLLHAHEMGLSLRTFGSRHHALLTELPSRYIAVSDAAKRALVEQWAIPEEKISLIHEFVVKGEYPSLLSAARNPGQPLIVGGSGYISWRKGIELWLLMAAEVKRLLGPKAAKFVWVGHHENADFVPVRHRVELLGLADDVEFVGVTQNPAAYYSQFDIIAMTTWEDSCPLVVLECMMLGKPVACFAGSGGAPEEVGDTGVVTHGFSPYDMAAKIVGLWRAPDRLAVLGEAARARAEAHFTDEVQVPKIREQIRLVVGTD